MATFKKTRFIAPITAFIVAAVFVVLYFYPLSAITTLDSNEVISVGFAGEDKEIFYAYPEKQAEEFIEMLKEAKLSGIPTRKFQDSKGGAPTFTTRIILLSDIIDISYLKAQGKTFLIINGLKYRCDEQTIESFRKISNECEELFKQKNNPTD